MSSAIKHQRHLVLLFGAEEVPASFKEKFVNDMISTVRIDPYTEDAVNCLYEFISHIADVSINCVNVRQCYNQKELDELKFLVDELFASITALVAKAANRYTARMAKYDSITVGGWHNSRKWIMLKVPSLKSTCKQSCIPHNPSLAAHFEPVGCAYMDQYAYRIGIAGDAHAFLHLTTECEVYFFI